MNVLLQESSKVGVILVLIESLFAGAARGQRDWQPWTNLSTQAVGDPQVLTMGGTIRVFVERNDEIEEASFDPQDAMHLSAWSVVGVGDFARPACITFSDPTLPAFMQQRIDCFTFGNTNLSHPELPNQLWHTAWIANKWTTWELVASGAADAPSVTSSGWVIDIFTRGSTNHLLHARWDFLAGTNGPWEDLGGNIQGAPACATLLNGHLVCFARGLNDGLSVWRRSSTPDKDSWTSLAGTLTSSPTVAQLGDRVDVIYRGPSGLTRIGWNESTGLGNGDNVWDNRFAAYSCAWAHQGRLDCLARTATQLWHTYLGTPYGVVTNNNGNARTGSYFDTLLTPSTVREGTIGKLHSWSVDGQIYAQPLYVHGLTMTDGTTHNVVYVATERNMVYAFDADPPYSELWQRALGTPAIWNASGCTDRNLYPWDGITSTPVIDLDHRMMYVVAHVDSEGIFKHVLYAMDIRNGHQATIGHITISAVASSKHPGSYDADAAGVVRLDSRMQLNRPGLLLASGNVYVAFGSHCDHGDYHGWVVAYRATDLVQVGVFNTTPSGREGSVWQAGRGLVADRDGNVYFMTGNGDVDTTERSLGESFVRLDSTLHLVDWFTPGAKGSGKVNDWRCLNANDLDLGSSGPLLIEESSIGTPWLVGGGKEGRMYLLDPAYMGGADHFHEHVSSTVTQEPKFNGYPCLGAKTVVSGGSETYHIHGGPVLDPTSSLLYLWGENDFLKVFSPRSTGFVELGQSRYIAPVGMPGGTLALSYGQPPHSSVVWVSIPLHSDANTHIVRGVLAAFQATPVCPSGPCIPLLPSGHPFQLGDLPQLWNSQMQPDRDAVGFYAKFCPPTIADGKVFLASFGDPNYGDDATRPGALIVYGLIGP